MELIKKLAILLACAIITLIAFAQQEKVIQIFRNGEIIQEYAIDDIDYIEVNDPIPTPVDVNATVAYNQIIVKWLPVENAKYNLYHSPDDINYTLLASNLIEPYYTDTHPYTPCNYYRVTTVINGKESKESQTVSAVLPENNLKSGIYLGIYGFSNGFQTQTIEHLSDETISQFHNFINGLNATQSFTWLYYAVDKSIDYLQSSPLPNDLSDVAVVTFTDGLDIGSLDEKDKEDPGKYLTNAQYRDAIHSRLTTEKVANIDISAYSIGVLEGKDASLTSFRNNMSSLSTSPSNIYEVEKMSNLNQVFERIANSLSETKYVQQFVLSISGHGEGEICRFTFDNISSYKASKLYIEGTYSRKDKALTNIRYSGLSSTSGTIIYGTLNGETGKYDFVFEGLKADDGSLIPTNKVQHWYTDDGIWQDVDDEFFFNPEDATIEKVKRSAAIMLNLDCSKSMNGQKLSTLKIAAQKFIQTLTDNSVDPSEVSSVTLDKTQLSLQIGENATLKATIFPSTAKLKTVTWNSTNPSVATVDGNGNITAVALGEANIVATTKDGGYTAICEIKVIPTPAPQNIKAVVNNNDAITISWSKNSNTTYTIYYSTDNNDYNVLDSNLTQNSYIDFNPKVGTNYYKIAATANNITSELSECVYAIYVPSPSNTSIQRVGKEIVLTWTSIDNATYNVYRSASSNLNSFVQISSDLNETTFSDKTPLPNKNYYLVRSVIEGVESKGGIMVNENYPFINGYEYIDLGLPSGIKWATQNVGATSPYSSGSYFAYGETSTKSTYSQSTYSNPSWQDAASSKWGGTWRIPDVNEFRELINYCTWSWTTVNNTQGYLVKGPNGNSIFLPTTGLWFESAKQSTDYGYYWSSSRWNDLCAWRLNFNSELYQVAENYKFVGIPIRPVTE